jgi:hypothetical protein
MDRFDCDGHKLSMMREGNDIIAACQCGKWRQAVPLAEENDLQTLVGRLVGAHCRHVDSWSKPSVDLTTASCRLPPAPASGSG